MIFISLYLLFCGKSCTDDSVIIKIQETEAEKAKDSIRHEFEADYLTEEARYAAETNAIRKLNDLADYLEIYADKSMDSIFRAQAGNMIRGLFDTGDAGLSFGEIKNRKMKYLAVDEFIEKGFGKDVSKAKVVFDSVMVLAPLQKSDKESYTGKLEAYQSVIRYSLTDSIISPTIPITIEFISSRQIKIVGSDTLNVWVVSLKGLQPKGWSPIDHR